MRRRDEDEGAYLFCFCLIDDDITSTGDSAH